MSPRPVAALIGIGMLVAGGSWIKFGVVLIVFGAFLAWWSKNLHHTLARDFIDAVEADESMGGRYRRVATDEDGLMVWGKSGKSQFFPFDKLDHVLDGERIFVAMFADQGVTIPKDTSSVAMPSSSVPSSRPASTKNSASRPRRRK